MGRWTGRVVAGLVAMVLVSLGVHTYVTAYGVGGAEPERAAAMKAARDTEARTHGHLWVAAYVPDAGEAQQSNTGHSCFGRTVLVRMVWKDASFDHGGISDGPDTPKGVALTADATTGTVCLITAIYGPTAAQLPSDAIYLFGPRRDLVPSQR